MQQNPNISVYVDGGGTATGAQALAVGAAEICTASRPLRPEEVKNIVENHGTLGYSFLVAKEAIAIFLNQENPVETFTLEEIKQIFTGEMDNWNKFAWQDTAIYLYGRSPNSGTRYYLREHVLHGESYSVDMQVLAGTSAIVRAVQDNPFAIGYGGLAYGKGVKLARVENIEITAENIRNDSYPITRYLYLYTVNKPRGQVKKFIDWTMTDAGQKIVQEAGYLPVIKF